MLAFSSDNLLTNLYEYYSYVMHVIAIMPLFFLLLCVCNVVDDTWCVTCTGALTSPKFLTSMIHASKLFLLLGLNECQLLGTCFQISRGCNVMLSLLFLYGYNIVKK